jgi:hypothetical protein
MARELIVLILRRMLLSLLLVSLAAPLFAGDVHFKILQLNDVYKIEGLQNGAVGGLARIRAVRKQLEADGAPVLLLHAGDLLFPSVASKYLGAVHYCSETNCAGKLSDRVDPGSGDYFKIDFNDQAARFAAARVIIGLTHQEFFDDDMVKAFPEIDFVVGGKALIAKGDAKTIVIWDVNVPARPPLRAPADPVKNDYRAATEATINMLTNKTIATAVEGRITAK